MQIDQSLVYIFALILVSLVLFVIGSLFAYLKLVRNYMDVKEGKDKYPDPKMLLLRAHAKSQKIIEEALSKADQIVSSSEILKSRNLDNIQKRIDKADSDYLKIYQETLSRINQESTRVLQNVPEYIKTLLSKESLNIRDQLFTEIAKTQENAKELILTAYKKVDQEVEAYKKARLDALDKSILTIVQDVSRKVLTREIDINEHEKLVLKALEEAKKQNIFSPGDIQDEDTTEPSSK